jgi:hypothetical protein
LTWNNFLNFIEFNYSVLLIMSMINVRDLRLSGNYTRVERFNSVFAILFLIVIIL